MDLNIFYFPRSCASIFSKATSAPFVQRILVSMWNAIVVKMNYGILMRLKCLPSNENCPIRETRLTTMRWPIVQNDSYLPSSKGCKRATRQNNTCLYKKKLTLILLNSHLLLYQFNILLNTHVPKINQLYIHSSRTFRGNKYSEN